jgi:hypothetical protein
LTPSAAQIARAKQLLAHEGGLCGTSEDRAMAAGRVHDKLMTQLAPLLGAAGAQALFARSAKLALAELPGLAEITTSEGSAKLQHCLRALDPAGVTDAATGLFARFFELITTFIGERLTIQALRSAWPTIEDMSSRETTK